MSILVIILIYYYYNPTFTKEGKNCIHPHSYVHAEDFCERGEGKGRIRPGGFSVTILINIYTIEGGWIYSPLVGPCMSHERPYVVRQKFCNPRPFIFLFSRTMVATS